VSKILHILGDVNGIFNIIKGRRAVRKFREDSIPQENLLKILEAGIWAPS